MHAANAPHRPWVVAKYGGTSVSSLERWRGIADHAMRLLSQNTRPFIVCSALSGISDRLEKLCESAPSGQFELELEPILERHRALAQALGLDADTLLQQEFSLLGRLAQGAALIGESSPALRARMLACGELMSTRLGAAYLRTQGLEVGWCDARQLLTAHTIAHESPEKHFLSASCPLDDASMKERLDEHTEAVLLTQGFIAADASSEGRTVLLGRGGSDTSAALFAARLDALRLEIWTDVPGMFSADPMKIPRARLLKRLSYDEAQELASMGGKVLHPASIAPVRNKSIPLQICCSIEPQAEGTRIGPWEGAGSAAARVKAVSAKLGVTVVSMDTMGMWQQIGFLADAFAVFKELGLSIDLVSTSESNVTLSLDAKANVLTPQLKQRLVERLSALCTVRLLDSCAVVSLVGQGIRSILSRLGPALALFEEHKVHLVSQAANDLNLSLVVDEAQAQRLVSKLHSLLLEDEVQDELFGASWARVQTARQVEEPWWQRRRAELLALAETRSPLFVYDAETLRGQAQALLGLEAVSRVYYAMKANNHDAVLRLLAQVGLHMECVSLAELDWARALTGEHSAQLLYTPNFASRQELEAALAMGAQLTLDSLYPLEHWPELFAGRGLMLRVDPGRGRGHHHHVRTAGSRSKFGVGVDELERAAALVARAGAQVVGLHAHVGSGVDQPRTWAELALLLEPLRAHFGGPPVLDLGGGLAVIERPGQARLDLGELGASLAQVKALHPELELWLEPGRYVVSEAGVLLSRVTQVKRKGAQRFIGLETGMNSLIRPALYGAHHGMVNLSRLYENSVHQYDVVGPICESGDVLGRGRLLPETQEGDVILITHCGAYGRVMSSRYNMREPAGELLLELGEP